MIKFNEVKLTDEARSKIVLLYLGCKLHGMRDMRINALANEVILAGATGKKLTFFTPHVIYNSDELINFVYDYTYEKMRNTLYFMGDTLCSNFMQEDGKLLSEKEIMLKLINKIFDRNHFDEVDDGDIYIAFTETLVLQIGANSNLITTPKQSPVYRHVQLVREAIRKYGK